MFYCETPVGEAYFVKLAIVPRVGIQVSVASKGSQNLHLMVVQSVSFLLKT